MKTFTVRSTLALAVVSFVLSLTDPSVALAAGPAPVNLLSAGNFVILSKAGITDIPASSITGNIGAYPITGAAIGVTCAEVTGIIYSRDAAGPLPCRQTNAFLLLVAVNNMVTAYNDAAGRPAQASNTNLYGGNLGGQTFAPGLYKWTTGVTIPTDVTLSGGANDVWIFQIAGDLTIASGASVPAGIKVILAGGAQAKNVFWQVGGGAGATLGTYATFNGTILSATQVVMQTGAVLNGRALAQTLVTLDHNTVSAPTSTQTPPNPNNNFLGEISGTKYKDQNGDGVLKYDTHALPRWTIYIDSNNSGVLDSGEPSALTDSSGNYRFPNLVAGTYIVREVGQAGWLQTYPSSGSHTIVLTAGQISKKNNFGNFKLETISGQKYNAANRKRRKDTSEVGLQGWTITLTRFGSPNVVTSTVTDSSGNYSFPDLGPGTYQVREVQQTGWVQTTNNPPNIKVGSGANCSNLNFGNHFGQVSKYR